MSGPNRANKYKRKRRSCAMCKRYKTGGENFFSRREMSDRRRGEREIREQ